MKNTFLTIAIVFLVITIAIAYPLSGDMEARHGGKEYRAYLPLVVFPEREFVIDCIDEHGVIYPYPCRNQ